MKLYEIIDEILAIGTEIHEAGEVTPELAEKLSATKIELADKMDSIAKLIKGWEAENAAIDIEQERLSALVRSNNKRIESLTWYVKSQLPQGKNFKTALFNWQWRKSQAVEVIDPEKIPAAYMREKVIREPDKKQIGDDLKCGATVPGVALVEKYHLSLK